MKILALMLFAILAGMFLDHAIVRSTGALAQEADATGGVARQLGMAIISFEQCRSSAVQTERKLQSELSNANLQCATTKGELADTKAELADTKAKLERMSGELAETKRKLEEAEAQLKQLRAKD